MNPIWLENYPAISSSFMTYGWFVPPFLVGYEFEQVRQAADRIDRDPPADDNDRRRIEDVIYRALCEPVYHPGYRARATWYGHHLEHMADFNHLYESAILSYYKREYAQAVLCLLSALEGILLSFYGFEFSALGRKPSMKQLLEKVKKEPPPSSAHPSTATAFLMYRDTLCKFLEDWIYKDTSQSDFTLSVLNRHYVLHGMDHGNFYRPHDLHRLILAFDLLVEFFSLRQGFFHVFIPDVGKEPFLDRRRGYYRALAAGGHSVAEARVLERGLLTEHRNYVAPSHDPSLEESLEFTMATMLELMAKFGDHPTGPGKSK